MNNLNLFVPQDSQSQQKARSRSRLKVTVFCVLAINIVGFMGALLLQGCKREQPMPPPENQEAPATADTNQPPMDTNAPVANTAPVTSEPTPGPAPAMTTAAASEYVVLKGDSFFTIGKKMGVSWKAIAEANPGVDSAKLKIGQKLVIPAASSTPSVVAGAVSAAEGEKMYVVKSGDTLTKIAKDHGTTYKAIKSANGLTTDRIKVGQKLKIPVKESAPAPAPEPAPAPAPAAEPPAH